MTTFWLTFWGVSSHQKLSGLQCSGCKWSQIQNRKKKNVNSNSRHYTIWVLLKELGRLILLWYKFVIPNCMYSPGMGWLGRFFLHNRLGRYRCLVPGFSKWRLRSRSTIEWLQLLRPIRLKSGAQETTTICWSPMRNFLAGCLSFQVRAEGQIDDWPLAVEPGYAILSSIPEIGHHSPEHVYVFKSDYDDAFSDAIGFHEVLEDDGTDSQSPQIFNDSENSIWKAECSDGYSTVGQLCQVK